MAGRNIRIDATNGVSEEMLEANALRITELTGAKRVLELRGPGLPFRGASWGGSMRLNTTWYPGNAKGSQQVLGATLDPSDFEGMWRRTLLGRAPCIYIGSGGEVRIVKPETLRDLIEDFKSKGSALDVTWSGIQRQGRISTATFAHDRVTDIGWKIKFEWFGAGAGTERTVLAARQTSGASDASSLEPTNEELTRYLAVPEASTRAEPRKPGTPNLSISDISNMMDGPQRAMRQFGRNINKAVGKVKSAVDLYNKARGLPYAVAAAGLAACDNVVSQCNQMVDSVSREPAEKRLMNQRASSLVKTASYYGQSTTQAQYLSRNARATRDKLAEQCGQGPNTGGGARGVQSRTQAALANEVKLHRVVDTDTLMGLSAKYYQTPDRAGDIARANGIGLPFNGRLIDQRRTVVIPP
jgi:hypothetical protein